MASFEATVLGKSPIWFFRMDELSGLVLHDKSTHATDGVIDASAVLGNASPVETDASSRAIYGPVGHIDIADAPLSDVRDNFTWIVFGYHNGSNITQLITRNGQIGVSGVNTIGFDGGAAIFSLSSAFLSDFGLASPALPAGWYMLSGRLNGAVMTLDVNGYTVAQRTDFPGTGIDPEASTRWNFGSSGNPGLWTGIGTDEAILLDYYASDADILEIYESARNRLPMFLTIDARSSLIIDSTPPPVYKPYPMRHNFDTPVIERISRLTGVQQIKDGREQRTGRATKTRRKLVLDTITPDAITRRQMTGMLWKNLRQPVPFPIAQDTVVLTAAATAGDTVIHLNTQYRDFDAGSRLRLGSDSHVELAEIVSLTLTSVTLKAPLANDWPISTRVAPMKLAYLDQELTPAGITSTKENYKVTGSVLVQDTPDSPNRITAHTPTYTHHSVEVFNPFEWGKIDFSDAVEFQNIQQGNLQDSDTGIFAIDTSDVASAQQGLGVALWLKGRDVISKFLGWYENRAGRLNKIWVPTMQHDIEWLDMTADFPAPKIEVAGTEFSSTYGLDDHRKDLCFVQKNNTLAFRRIVAVTQSGGNDYLQTDIGSLDGGLELTTRFICFLRLCRLDADEIELAWHTSDLVRVVFKFREVLNEVA